ncbi:hypothetical protein BFJ63_vAg12831 [Fusarium oxysporum f. sp. narcissi]|jgi:hypothetical protein|uniref:Uncharacterized protein n=1 Tax=Fusarium oxysporum f. sp. narcissi TaxID=451672 RepID=A0A4Q2VA42_FUSOX|nr:hypothetical protein BFJ63_vAg12831 [Fusarium oxysporum f. sp. narcissi]
MENLFLNMNEMRTEEDNLKSKNKSSYVENFEALVVS